MALMPPYYFPTSDIGYNRFAGFGNFEKDISLFTAPFSYEQSVIIQCDSVFKEKYNEMGIP